MEEVRRKRGTNEYAIYNLVSVINTIRKNDIEFYSGEITGKDDKGYFLKGVSAYRFHFIKKMQPDPEPDADLFSESS